MTFKFNKIVQPPHACQFVESQEPNGDYAE